MSEALHKAFYPMMESALGADAVRALLEAMEQPSPASVRLNPSKIPSPPAFADAEPVAWSPWGRYLAERPVYTLDPLLHAGAYYVQDASAMAVGDVLRACLPEAEPAGRPIRVLDACAAPGGKTTDAAASLRERYGDGFLLVANEVMRQRVSVLRDNVAIWGDPCVCVTSADPAAFSPLKGLFDIILADVPCSGEGMFRKDAGAVSDWSPAIVDLCAARQRRIISDLWPSLREGGVLIYSTCTFNRIENAGNVDWIVSTLGAERISEPWTLVPGQVRGEGQFVIALRKTSPAEAFRLPKAPPVNAQVPKGLLRIPCVTRLRGGVVVAVPEVIAAEVVAISPLRPLSVGTLAGEYKGSDWVPSADLALSLLLLPDAYPSVALTLEEARAFLHRDALTLPRAPKGFVLVRYNGLPLGFVKNLGPRCNNLHPKDRRIRMDI